MPATPATPTVPPTSPSAGDPHRSGHTLRRVWWWTFVSLALADIAFGSVALVGVVRDEPLATPTAALIVLVIVAAIAATWRYRAGFGALAEAGARTRWTTLGPLALSTGALLAVTLTTGLPALTGVVPLWLGLNVAAPLVDRALRVPVLLAGLVVVVGVMTFDPGHRFPIGARAAGWMYLAIIPLVLWPTLWFWSAMLRLDAARRDSAALAVAEERLRFAGDLHDVQGHHLQVIALKTDLAGRLLDGDLEAARAQLAEANDLAREALRGTRALVHDYRRVPLAREVANAETVLVGAGLECRAQVSADAVPEPVARVLGLTVREATTNVLRHADATWTELALVREVRTTTLRIVNDGVRDDPGGPRSGLAILTRRVRDHGGRVEAERRGDTFTLTVTVPDPEDESETADGTDGDRR